MGAGLGASGGTDGPSAQQSLGQILEAAVSVGSRTLEVQLDSLLAALHAQVGSRSGGRGVPVEGTLARSELQGVLWGALGGPGPGRGVGVVGT